ncbi:MAG: T9SS type A sorting domain-containing protein [Sphingobacteriales bacterium]|nr:MAG: T9SS type A sorting domain-containing protein [Sphingobacteriales bacterium]
MKKALYFMMCIGLSLPAIAQKYEETKPRLSPFTKLYLQQSAADAARSSYRHVYKQDNAGNLYISALLKVNKAKESNAMSAIEAIGARIGTRAGEVWTAQVPVNKVKQLTEINSITYIQLDEPNYRTLDEARKTTKVDSVHIGIDLLYPFTGSGVVVGIIDAGFDYTHPVFFDSTGTKYRVKKVWEQKSTGTAPAGFSYGSELTTQNDIWAKGRDNDGSHGTHVGGIAGGSGFGGSTDNRRFRGMAYQSDLVFVGITPAKSQWANTGASDIVDGMNYIYSYAASVGKPAVANLSWGGPVGPRDGSSLFSVACDNLTGTGKIFSASAGNNGEQNMHIRKSFTATDTVVSTFINIEATPIGKITWLDMWGQQGKSFCTKVKLYGKGGFIDSTGFICLDDLTHSEYMIGSNMDTCFVDFMTSTAEFNGKPRLMIEFRSKVADSICISVSSTDGAINMWTGFVHNTIGYYSTLTAHGFSWATNGNNTSTLSDISSSKSAISVGAYASKTGFKNVNGLTQSLGGYVAKGDLVPFSSRGPAADNRVKPDITGPGFMLGSAVSSYDGEFQAAGARYDYVVALYTFAQFSKTYPFAMLYGTSMSSPAVAGIVALMLEANPKMGPQQVMDILNTTAIKDNYTGAIPAGGNNNWGNGKVNAYAAVKKAWQTNSVEDVADNKVRYELYPNPAARTTTITYNTAATENVVIEVLDLSGKRMYSQDWKVYNGYNSKNLNLEALTKGFYLVKLHTAKGVATTKLVIE